MKIDVTFDSSAASAPAGFEAVVDDVAAFYDSEFSNPITINIDVGWGEVNGQALDASALGESDANFANSYCSYGQVRSALIASAQTAEAKTAVATLPSTDPTNGGTFSMTTAEAKALGFLSGSSSIIDGYVGFTSQPDTFDFSVTSNLGGETLPSGNYDFFGVVAHEFSEIMGRQMNFGMNYGGGPGDGSGYYPLDLFDYSASGVRTLNGSATSPYFSIDGGVTDLGDFNTDPSGDLFDWASNAGWDAFVAFAQSGVENQVTTNDLTLMNVLGYQLTPAFTASAASLTAETLSFTIANTSQAAAPASTAGVYLGPPETTPTAADTLLANSATPALAPGGSLSQSLALAVPLSHAAPGFYSLAVVPDANGAVAQSNAAEGSSNVLEIGILDSADVGSVPQQDAGLLCFDLGGLAVANSAAVFGLYVSAALDGAGGISTAGETLTFAPGASLGIARIDVNSRFAVVDTNLAYAGEWNGSINTETLIVAGHTFDLSGVADIIDGQVSGAGTLAFSGACHVTLGYALDVSHVDQSGASVVRWTNASNLTYGGAWDQSAGALAVAKGGRMTFEGAGDTFAGTITGAGLVAFTRGSVTFDGATLSAALTGISEGATLEGEVTLSGELAVSTPNLIVGAAGATLAGGGTLAFTDSAANRLFGAVDQAVLTNLDDRIVGAGNLGDGEAALVNDAGGVIDGDAAAGLTLDSSQTIANAGLIDATDKGVLTIDSPLDNTGRLFAASGDVTVEGPVTGNGVAWVNGGTLDFAAAFSENVVFGKTGVLELARSQSYGGLIAGFSKTGATSLDLRDIAFGAATKATYAGTAAAGTLTVTDGTHTARIRLEGDFLASTFHLAGDGAGGVTVTDPPVARFAQAMAALAARPAPATSAPTGPGAPPPPALASPRAVS